MQEMESLSQNEVSVHPGTAQHSNAVPLFNEFLLLLAWQNTLDGENQNLFHFLCCLAACFLCSDQLVVLVVPGDEDGAELLSQSGCFSVVVALSALTWNTAKDKTNFYSSLSSDFLIVKQGTQDVMISLRGLSPFLK